MAVITLQTIGAAQPAQRIATRLKAMAAATRAIIDSYVSYRMQTSASEAEHIRQPAAGIARSTTFPTVPVQPEPMPAEDTRDETERALQPLDPGTISDVIPAFFIGRNHDGMWVAREAKGAVGGIFLFKDSAIAFARRHSGSAGCATIFPAERFELDIANNGNSLAAVIGRLPRLGRRMWRSATSPTGAAQRR
jgi:hypothetical protein